MAARILVEPGITTQFARVLTKEVSRTGSSSTGVLPFRFRRQAIATRLKVALPGLQVVAGLQSLRLRTVVAEPHRVGPTHLLDRVSASLPTRRVVSHQLFKVLLSHQIFVHQKTAHLNFMVRSRSEE